MPHYNSRLALFDPSNLTNSEKVVLNHYSRLAEATDRFHEKLLKFLSSRRRPTVLIIFGDHLPPLMDNFGLYYSRMVESVDPADWSIEEKMRMYSTPLIQWSNFNLEEEIEPLQVVFLGVRLLRKLGLSLTPYQFYVAQVSDKIRILNPFIKLPESTDLQVLINDYHILQHHAMIEPLGDFQQPQEVTSKKFSSYEVTSEAN